MGRHTTFTQKAADEIVDRLSKGEPLAWICNDDHLPAVRTVSAWRSANETFDADFARARDEGFDAIALDALHIADDNGKDTRYTKDGAEVADSEWISRSKLRVDTRLKLLAKWDPKRYGDKIAHVGGDPATDSPIQSQGTIRVEGAPEDVLRWLASQKVEEQ